MLLGSALQSFYLFKGLALSTLRLGPSYSFLIMHPEASKGLVQVQLEYYMLLEHACEGCMLTVLHADRCCHSLQACLMFVFSMADIFYSQRQQRMDVHRSCAAPC